MDIYVQRFGQQLGPPYSLEEAKVYLSDGLLQPDDLAWTIGMAEWTPLSNLMSAYRDGNEQAEQSHYLQTQIHQAGTDAEAFQYGQQEYIPADVEESQVSAEELGQACFDLALGFRDSYTGLIMELQQVDMDGQIVDFGQVWIELICLGIFSVEHALRDTIKSGPSEAVLDAYHKRLKLLVVDGVPNFYEAISNGFPIYEHAIHARHPHGVAWNVGETFAIFCGSELSTRLVMTGSTLFDKVYGYVHQWIHEIGVDNIVEE